jgi:hypothetical protein
LKGEGGDGSVRVYVNSRGRAGIGCGCLPVLIALGLAVAVAGVVLGPLGSRMNGRDAWWITTLAVLGPLVVWWIVVEIRNARR